MHVQVHVQMRTVNMCHLQCSLLERAHQYRRCNLDPSKICELSTAAAPARKLQPVTVGARAFQYRSELGGPRSAGKLLFR